MKRHFLSAAMAGIMFLSMIVPVHAQVPFSDTESIQHKAAVEELVNKKIITGYPDGTFRPSGSMTRAEACAILTRALQGSASERMNFADVSGDHWAKGYIAYCAERGLVVGYGDGNFGPEDSLTGSAWSAMVLRAFGQEADGDQMLGIHWEDNVYAIAEKANLYEGLNPYHRSAALNRDYACQILFNGVYREGKDVTLSPSERLDHITYSFGNTQDTYSYPSVRLAIPQDRFNLVYGETVRALHLFTRQGLWSGNCFGMSGSAGLFYVRDNNVKTAAFRANTDVPKELYLNDRNATWQLTLKEFIEAVQIIQYDENISRLIYQTNANDMEGLVEEVEKFAQGRGNPAIITVFSNKNGHALVGYDVQKYTDLETRVMVYDCNYPQDISRYITLHKNSNGEYTGWEFGFKDKEVWSSDDQDSLISYVPYASTTAIWNNRSHKMESDMMLLSVNRDADIYDIFGHIAASVRNGIVTVYQKNIFPMAEIDATNPDITSFWMPAEYVLVKQANGRTDDFYVNVTHLDQSAEITTDAPEVFLSVDDSKKECFAGVPSMPGLVYGTSFHYDILLRNSFTDDSRPKESHTSGDVGEEGVKYGYEDETETRPTQSAMAEDDEEDEEPGSGNKGNDSPTPEIIDQTITGRVVDLNTGEPIDNAHVVFKATSRNGLSTFQTSGVRTASDGTFTYDPSGLGLDSEDGPIKWSLSVDTEDEDYAFDWSHNRTSYGAGLSYSGLDITLYVTPSNPEGALLVGEWDVDREGTIEENRKNGQEFGIPLSTEAKLELNSDHSFSVYSYNGNVDKVINVDGTWYYDGEYLVLSYMYIDDAAEDDAAYVSVQCAVENLGSKELVRIDMPLNPIPRHIIWQYTSA